MTPEELYERFPEIPADLRDEPVLSRFAEVFDTLLRAARMPGACATSHDAPNHYYLKLVGPLSIYGYGLSTREKVLAELQELLDRNTSDPAGFAAGLLPEETVDEESRGPGCS